MLTTCKPRYGDLWFKQRMLSDEETMSYNHAYGGTIPFPEERWQDWYSRWLGNPDGRRFYRYLKDDTGTLVGELSWHYDEEAAIYLADVLIHAEYRGNGYGGEALELLCSLAREHGISALYDDIAADNPAIGLFLRHGFSEAGRTERSALVKRAL